MQTPCQEHYGKPFVELEAIREADPKALTPEAWFEEAGAGQSTPEGIRRRRAIQACHLDCPSAARLGCLLEGLEPNNINQPDGIFGGYTVAERREIVAEAERRGVDIKTNIARMIESVAARSPSQTGLGLAADLTRGS